MASFGAALALRSLLEFIFTSEPAYFSRGTPDRAAARRSASAPRPTSCCRSALALVLVVAVHLLLTRTAIGRAMRAVSREPGARRRRRRRRAHA